MKKLIKKVIAKAKPFIKIARSVYHELVTEVRRLWHLLPQTWRQRVAVASMSFFVLAVGIVSLTGLGIYALGWENGWSKAVARVVPYPAGFVGTSPVNFHDYLVEKRTAQVLHQKEGAKTSEISAQAFGQSVNHVLVAKEASKMGIKVTSKEVREEVKRIFDSQGGEKESLKILKDEYGLNRSDFNGRVYHQLLRLKLDKALNNHPRYLEQARGRAAEVIAKLKRKSDFSVLAREYSAHPSAYEEGDKALVLASTLPAVINAKAQELADGELYTTPMKVETSYYVLKRVKASADGIQTQVIQVVAENSSTWLSEAYSKNKLTRLLPSLR